MQANLTIFKCYDTLDLDSNTPVTSVSALTQSWGSTSFMRQISLYIYGHKNKHACILLVS